VEFLPGIDGTRKRCSFPENFFAFSWSIPEAVLGYDFFDFFKTFLFVIQVKDNP
jgi:hypothetical protein